MAFSWLRMSRDDLALHRRSTSVTSSNRCRQKDDQHHLRVILCDRVRDLLEQNRFPGARRRDDEPALPFSDRRQEVHDPRRHVIAAELEPQLLLGIERREVVEKNLVLGDFGALEIDRLHPKQGEVPLPVLGRAHLARDRVARAKVESFDLRGGDINVIRTWQVVVVGRAEEAVALGEDLEDPLREDQPVLLGLSFEDLEDQLLLSQAARALNAERVGQLHQFRNRAALELDDVEAFGGYLRTVGGRRRR